MQLDGETILFPILGHPTGQVRSPRHLTGILDARGINAIVPAIDVAPVDLGAMLDALGRAVNVRGVVITMPHKIAALAHCSALTDRARFAGSVNVMRKTATGWSGDNVDGIGYMDGIEKLGFSVAGKPALLIGAGGAGCAVAYEILARGASHLTVAELDETRRTALITALDAAFPGRVAAGSSDPTGMALVANVTPCGMRAGDPHPADSTKFTPEMFVADSITKPAVTPMLEAARALGCGTMPGEGMFTAQAEKLVDILLGQDEAAAAA